MPNTPTNNKALQALVSYLKPIQIQANSCVNKTIEQYNGI